MRDDLLKEQLMSYARTGADEAFQPGAAAIHRRARRHYRRVAALTVTGVVLAVGLGAGIGLRRDGGAPTVGQPTPTLTGPGPAVPSTTPTTQRPVTSAGKRPGTFVGDVGGRVAMISTFSGKEVHKLVGPDALGGVHYSVGISPDRSTVYFSQEGCDQPGIFKVPAAGGRVVRVVAGDNATGQIEVSADGSRLAYTAIDCASDGPADIVVRQTSGALVKRWPTLAADTNLYIGPISLSPDGRLLAVPQTLVLDPLGVRVLDIDKSDALTGGRLIQAPDPRCQLVAAEFEPRGGRLAAFERCLPANLQSTTPPRFQLLSLDASDGRLRSRSLSFDDPTRGDLHVGPMDFDQSGRHLLYQLTTGTLEPRSVVGTWRYSGGQPVRVHDDRRLGNGQVITTQYPTW